MALRKKTLAIPLTGPLERRNGGEDLTANLTALPAIPRALNVYRSRTGEWKQRPGHVDHSFEAGFNPAPVFSHANLRGARHVLVGDRQAVLSEGDGEVLGYVAEDYGSLLTPGLRSSVITSVSDAVTDSAEAQAVATATAGGVTIYATTSYNGGWYVTLSSRLNGDDSALSPRFGGAATVQFAGGQPRTRLLYSKVRDLFVFVFTNPGNPSTAATRLAAFAFSPAQALSLSGVLQSWFVGSTSLVTDVIGTATSVNGHIDAMVEANTGLVLVAYRGTGSNTRVFRFDPATMTIGTGPVSVVAGGDVAANSLAWARVADWTQRDTSVTQSAYRLITAINSAVGVVDRIVSKTTLLQTSSATVMASPGNVGAVAALIHSTHDGINVNDLDEVLFDVIGTAPSQSTTWGAFRDSGAWFPIVLLPTSRLHGMPFVMGPRQIAMIPVVGAVDTAGKIMLIALRRGDYTAVFGGAFDGVSDSLPAVLGQLADASYEEVSSSFYYGAVRWLSRSGDPTIATTDPRAYVKTAHAIKIDYAGLTPLRSVGLDDLTAFFPGASWKMADQSWLSGAPWSAYQAGPPVGLTLTGGGPMTPGDYYYVTLSVCVDSNGRRWTGIPSAPVKFTVAAPGAGCSMIITGVASGFGGTCVTELYRTKGNGTQWFRLGQFGSSGSAFLDLVSDAVLETGLPLYTDSGELLHVPPPPSHIAVVAGNRIVCVNSERPSEVWASSEFTPGEGPWFHPDMRLAVPGGEEIVALAFMDGRTYLFTRKSIFAVAGSWPGRTGSGQLPEVQRVATGIGAYSHETTLVTSEGVWFYSEERGISLLNRGMAIVPAGKIIDGVMTSPPIIAIQAESYDQVRLYRSDGTVAVYDQVERQWSHWQIQLGGGETIVFAYVHAGVVYVCTNLRTLKEDPAAKTDAGSAFDVGVDARIPIGPPGGKARVYRAILSGLITGETKLSCTVFNDFGQVGSDEDTKIMIVKPRAGETLPALYEQTIKPKRGRCDSMLLRFSYRSTEGGVSFRALAVEVGGYQPATVARPGSSRQA